MTEYRFAGISYRNSREMHTSIAEEWLSAGGRNDREDMIVDLARTNDADLATEVLDNWDANDRGGDDAAPPTSFDRDELIRAFADIRANFDKHFPPPETVG